MEGLRLYENMVDAKEVSQLVSLVNNLRTAGRRGQLQSKNPFFLLVIIKSCLKTAVSWQNS